MEPTMGFEGVEYRREAEGPGLARCTLDPAGDFALATGTWCAR